MATIYIGHASQDENGNYTGGSAGDQTGKEVCIRTFYVHSKGWYVFRLKNVTYANKMATLMTAACNNANIGYDQGNRLGIITYGINTTTKTECDCSSLVREVIIEATGIDPGNFTTANEASKLAATGLFEDKFSYVSQSSTPVYNGDVLVTKTKGHTAIITSGNARSSSSSSSSSSSTITVDGSWGKNTTKKAQTVLGTTVDGYVSGQLTSCKKYLSAADSGSWKFSTSGSGSQLIKALQKKIGMSSSEQDGLMGKDSVKALQKYVGVTQDGYMGSKTVTAFQTWLNAQ